VNELDTLNQPLIFYQFSFKEYSTGNEIFELNASSKAFDWYKQMNEVDLYL